MAHYSFLNSPKIANFAALIAIIISIAGLFFAFKAYELSSTQYTQERLLVLIGEFGKKENTIFVKSINANIKFIKGQVLFPSEIHEDPVPIGPKGNFWHLGTIIFELKSHVRKKIPAKKGVVKISQGQIPILISSYYVTNGEAYTDNSIYMLGVQIQVNQNKHEEPIIRFKNLSFVKRIKNNFTFGRTELDDLFNNMEKGNGVFIPGSVLY